MNKIELPSEVSGDINKYDLASKYILPNGLKAAVEVAIKLDQPLLITGEPGTGKTSLAFKVAFDLSQMEGSKYNFRPKPLVFNTKTTSESKDLFYQYDAVNHFYKASVKDSIKGVDIDPMKYIKLHALGKAIATTNSRDEISHSLILGEENFQQSTVVLIDEIDKAPRDFPNDILHEIDKLEFTITEANNHLIKKSNRQKIIIILTSNSESNLPGPFLRRCVFYHIPFPSKPELIEIVASQINNKNKARYDNWVDHFLQIRDICIEKKPSTAELISWLRVLELESFFETDLFPSKLNNSQKEILRFSYSILAKTKRDIKSVTERLLK